MFVNILIPALMGWAGGAVFYQPGPDDDNPVWPPWWWWLIRIAIGIIGGILSSTLITSNIESASLASIALVAFAGGSILTDLANNLNIVRR